MMRKSECLISLGSFSPDFGVTTASSCNLCVKLLHFFFLKRSRAYCVLVPRGMCEPMGTRLEVHLTGDDSPLHGPGWGGEKQAARC